MDEINILLQNPNKLANTLSPILGSVTKQKILNVGKKHSKLLLKLSRQHLLFAKKIHSNNAWRQKISRGYYCCYNASKAVRLINSGEYSQEGKDHQKIGTLPIEFNRQSFWTNFLTQFRSDRNLADYDHDKKCGDLQMPPKKYIEQAELFYLDAKNYLHNRGVS